MRPFAPLAVLLTFCLALLAAGCGSSSSTPAGPTQDASTTGSDTGIQVDAGPSCATKTCTALGFACGAQNDGCGNVVECGTCPQSGACESGKCACVPTTCAALQVGCGSQSDGCGGMLDCGKCGDANLACVSGQCQCQPATCMALGANCGMLPDGCGGTAMCGTCTAANAPNCGGGGANKCGANACTKATCGTHCGTMPDGCGGTLTCPATCTAPQTCGGGGTANACGCTPTTCAKQGVNCGSIPDGCGGMLACGSCAVVDQTCGGGGKANVCGCTPTTCAKAGYTCGALADGCGNTLNCGACVSPDTCGAITAGSCGCKSILTSCDECCGTGTDNCGRTCTRTTCCGTCFVAGTRITMADGSLLPIEQVHTGDRVKSYDPEGFRVGVATVTGTVKHGAELSVDGIVVIDGVLHVTPNHPVLVGGRLVRADAIAVGDEVVTHQAGNARGRVVSRVEREPGGVPTFDLQVDGPGTFFAEGIVVNIKPQP